MFKLKNFKIFMKNKMIRLGILLENNYLGEEITKTAIKKAHLV